MESTQPTLKARRANGVCAVIVTYNRLELLKACLHAVLSQTVPPEQILIVDNGSTDGTSDYLKSAIALGTTELLSIRQPNKGSSDGFATGIKEAFATTAAWFWCMDDDTIPDSTCLEAMLSAATRYEVAQPKAEIGWLNSVIRWSDGALHLMNEPALSSYLAWGNRLLDSRTIPAKWCSYVSLMISRQAVQECGVPLREMFIWYDDVEYTARIVQKGYVGLVVLDSTAEHRTASNYCPDLKDLGPANIGRFKYAFRNSVVTLRRQTESRHVTFLWRFARLFARRIVMLIRCKKWRYLWVACSATISGLFFDLKPEFVGLGMNNATGEKAKGPRNRAPAMAISQ